MLEALKLVVIVVNINIFITNGRLKRFQYMKFIVADIYHQTIRIRLTMYVMSVLKQYTICSEFFLGKENLWEIESSDLVGSLRYCQG